MAVSKNKNNTRTDIVFQYQKVLREVTFKECRERSLSLSNNGVNSS
jgi:hypothetical protein